MARLKTATFLTSVALILGVGGPQSAYGVPSSSYNKVCKRIHQVSGRSVCGWRTHSPAPTARYRLRKSQLIHAKNTCHKQAQRVRATFYGGPSDSSSGTIGYRGDDLSKHPFSFAELSTNWWASANQLDFAALGGLPNHAKRWVHYHHHDRMAVKRDVGAGGPRLPKIDLWYRLAEDLHFNDGFVRLTTNPCRGVFNE